MEKSGEALRSSGREGRFVAGSVALRNVWSHEEMGG